MQSVMYELRQNMRFWAFVCYIPADVQFFALKLQVNLGD